MEMIYILICEWNRAQCNITCHMDVLHWLARQHIIVATQAQVALLLLHMFCVPSLQFNIRRLFRIDYKRTFLMSSILLFVSLQQCDNMDPQQQFCLKWNSYSSNLAITFSNLFKSDLLADVTLFCSGKFACIIIFVRGKTKSHISFFPSIYL